MDLKTLASCSTATEQQMLAVARHVHAIMLSLQPELCCTKTLDFTEAVALFSQFSDWKQPEIRVLELGTQHGVSTRLFHDVFTAMGIRPIIRTYDIEKQAHCFNEELIDFRVEDITAKSEAVLDEFKPNAVFLDAHPWQLTLNLTQAARQRGLLIFMHDVADQLWHERLLDGLLPLEGHECDPRIPWERKVLESVFGEGIHQHHHETEDYIIDIINSNLGLAICRPKQA